MSCPHSDRASEPQFKTERELEDAVAEHIRSSIGGVVLRGFGLDLAAFTTTDEGTVHTRFFEIKAYNPASARCGIGNQRGEGNQIRLLLDDSGKTHRSGAQAELLDQSIRWVLGDTSQQIGSRRFLFFSCTRAQEAAMGGRICVGKQNNLRLTAFRDSWITWSELLKRIDSFMRHRSSRPE